MTGFFFSLFFLKGRITWREEKRITGIVWNGILVAIRVSQAQRQSLRSTSLSSSSLLLPSPTSFLTL